MNREKAPSGNEQREGTIRQAAMHTETSQRERSHSKSIKVYSVDILVALDVDPLDFCNLCGQLEMC